MKSPHGTPEIRCYDGAGLHRLIRVQMQPTEWLVFEDGRLVARLESPAGFQVMDVAGGRVAGVWTNDLGVEFVRIYEYR